MARKNIRFKNSQHPGGGINLNFNIYINMSKVYLSTERLVEVASKFYDQEFDEFVDSQKFIIGQLNSMIKERKTELENLVSRLKKEQKLIPKLKVDIVANNGTAHLEYFNPKISRMEKKTFDLGNIHWFDNIDGLEIWAKIKCFQYLKTLFPSYYN